MHNNIDISIADPNQDACRLAYLRGLIFGGEQGISFNDEYACEAGAIYIMAQDGEEPVGLIRFRCFKDFVKLERMGILQKYRKTNLAKELFERALSVAGMMGYDKAYGICEEPLLKYWQQYGFNKIEGAPSVALENKTFYAISGAVKVPENHIRMTDNPNRINAPVGDWDAKRKALGFDDSDNGLTSNFLVRIKHAKLYETRY